MTGNVSRSTLLLFLGAFALFAVGCGGGGSELSEDEFIDEFDDVCGEVTDDLDAIEAEFADLEGDDFDGAADLSEEAGEVLSDGIDELSGVDPPEDLQDELDELLGLLEDRADLWPDLAEAFEDEDEEAVLDLLDEVPELDADTQAVSEDIGLECYAGDEDQSDDFSGDLSDSSSDLSDDFSDDFSDSSGDLGEPLTPSEVIPEYGTVDRDARFDGLADSCYVGELSDCDRLYQLTPVSESTNSYEGYGATCGGRLAEEDPGTCAARG